MSKRKLLPTKERRQQIKERYGDLEDVHVNMSAIAREYDVPTASIKQDLIALGLNHLTIPKGSALYRKLSGRGRRQISDEQVEEMRRLRESDKRMYTYSYFANQYGVTLAYIGQLIRNDRRVGYGDESSTEA